MTVRADAGRGSREYHFDTVTVPPGESRTVQLECYCKRPISGTGIPGHPETQLSAEFATEMAFQPHYIEFSESCRKAFLVTACFIGQLVVWYDSSARNVTAELLSKRPDIKFPVLVDGLNMTMQVTNTSNDVMLLVAKVVGEDLPNYGKVDSK